jgi:hypothetical protein
MSIIIPFVPRPDLSAKENLNSFISNAKKKKIFQGPNAISWNENTWHLQPWVTHRGAPRTYTLHFNNYESTGRAKQKKPLSVLFMDSAKALAAHGFDHKATTPYRWVIALRSVEKAYRELNLPTDITQLDAVILDKAAEIISKHYADPSDYGTALQNIAKVVSDGCLSKSSLDWKFPFPFKRNNKRSVNVNANGTAEISSKLPHLKCILDLASVFQNAKEGSDLITTAWFALAMFAPNRVSEILTLPYNCITEMDGVFGISWQPSKDGSAMTKFTTGTEWEDVARLAINRLIKYGEPSRVAAAWYRKNPQKLYLPIELEHLRGQPVTQNEIMNIIGCDSMHDSTFNRLFNKCGETTRDPLRTEGSTWRRLYEFSSLEQWVLNQLPETFPVVDKLLGTLAENSLFCLPRQAMRSNVATQYNIPEFLSDGQILKDLGSHQSNIFHRHELIDPTSGRYWKLTTHQPRHFLNTLAQSKHISQTLIAFWSGRKSVDQNSWYNHIPHEVFIEAFVTMGENAPKKIKVVGPLEKKIEVRARKEQISKDDAMKLELGSIISTRFGMCRHNYALTPCPKDKDCIGCGENTFIKGDERQIDEARKQLEISENALKNCEEALIQGEPGVERWLIKHEAGVKRWAMALELLTDPDIDDGTLITLPAPDKSQTKVGLTMNIRKAKKTDNIDDLDTLFSFGFNR